MIFYLIGIDHKTTPFKIREKISLNKEEILDYWKRASLGNTSILFTCNRVEIYGVANTLKEAEHLEKRFITLFNDVFSNAYVIYGKENILRHGLRLASGLESQLQGEMQIIQQLKQWFDKNEGNDNLSDLWNDIIVRAESIRKETKFCEKTPNIADIVFSDLLKRIKKDKPEVLIIGTGKIAQLIAENKPDSIKISFVARKNRNKAKKFAKQVNGQALLLEEMSQELTNVDAIISATSSPHYALKPKHFNDIANKRERNLYIYDLAMPRDVDPDIGKLGFNKIIDIEQIIIQRNLENIYLKDNIEKTLKLIEDAVENYRREDEASNRIKTEQACFIAS